jgi:hypothetical protein
MRGKERNMAWAVVRTRGGGEVESVAVYETWEQAVESVVRWAAAEDRLRGPDEGEDFMALRSSWTLEELRELLEEDGSCTDDEGARVSVIEVA